MATSPFYNQTFFDPTPVNGITVAASNGYLKVFAQGSSTLANIWVDAALSIPQANPLTFNGAGQCPQYFVNDGQALDYKAFTSDDRVIMTALNVTASSGMGGGTGDHKVATDVGDSAPDYLGAKLLTSTSVRFSLVSPGGVHLMTAQVDEGWLASWIAEEGFGASDHKVLTDATAGDVPGYLVAKFVDADGNPLTVNGAHQLVLPFARLDGAAFTGSVSVAGQLSSQGDTALATGAGSTVHLVGPATIEQAIANLLTLPGITPGQWLMLNGSGQVVGVAAPSSDHKVLYDLSDAIPGFLGVKVQAGSGIQINVTTDGVNGKVMHFNLNPANIGTSLIRSYLQSIVLSSTATTIINKIGGIGNTISANSLAVGDMIKIRVSSFAASGVTSGFAVSFALNGTMIVGTTYVSNISFVQEYDIIITSIGPSGTYVANAAVFSQGLMGVNNNSTSSIDTTVANTIDVIASTTGTAILNQVIITMEKN